jgi:HAD superfamily hydrolase (TIGR01490 family)
VSSSAECSKQEATAEEGTISVSANKRGVAFFDLDHTVIDTNSSWHWVQHEMHAGRVGAHMILTAIYWFARYAAGFGAGAERAGAEAAELYAGTLASDLEAEVNVFFDKHMRHRQRPGCEAAIEKHSLEGTRCLICTTSWQHPARAAAKLFGLETAEDDVISSVMEIDETTGCLTGKIETVAYGDGKYEVTKKWCDRNGVDLKDCVFYTDSMSDVLLMEHVGTPVAVNPDARLRAFAKERGWQIVDWGVAEARARKPRYSYGCLNFGGSHVGPG